MFRMHDLLISLQRGSKSSQTPGICQPVRFRPRHSTEFCLTHLTDSILEGCDKGLHTGIILIDLQNVFDTIYFEILLGKMTFLNFSPSTIAWFRSYLTNRSFIVDVDSTLSEPAELVCGVPQGSILGFPPLH